MPNWCKGNIGFRGKMEDILKLIKEQFLFCKIRWNEKTKQFYTEKKAKQCRNGRRLSNLCDDAL